MQLYFADYIENELIHLSPFESNHCIRVLRHKVGDQLLVTDGHGKRYTVEITKADSKKTITKIIQYEEIEVHGPQLHIAIALTKNINRMEWLFEKLTEIGVHRITPLICKRSERKHWRKDRLDRIILSALKQSKQFNLPLLDELIPFTTFIKENENDQLFIPSFHPDNEALENAIIKDKNASFIIGPEGDFTFEELNEAQMKNYVPVNLSENRLRTETAGFVAAQIFHSMNQKK